MPACNEAENLPKMPEALMALELLGLLGLRPLVT
jgi:hypothetical protein